MKMIDKNFFAFIIVVVIDGGGSIERVRSVLRAFFGEFFRKLFGVFKELFLVLGKLFGKIGSQRMFGLGIIDESDQRLNHLIGLCCRFPILVVNDGQAHLTLLVDIRMIDFRLERNLGRFERILGWKIDLDLESTFVVGWVVGHDETLPVEYVLLVDDYISK